MSSLLEYVGYVHIYLGPYRGNPIALYLMRSEKSCRIGPKAYPWNDVIGIGETPNKAAADFEAKWKGKGLSADMYSGPSWEGGIKPEKPAPPKPAATPKPAPSPAPGGAAQPGSAAPAPAPAGAGGTTAPPSAPAKPSAQPPSTAPAPAGAGGNASPPSAPAKAPAKPSTPTMPQGDSKS